MGSQCPEVGRLQAYTDGEFMPDERMELEKHLAICQPCARMVAEMVHENDWLHGLFESENEALRLSTSAISRQLADIGVKWIWAAIGLAVLGAMLVLMSSYWLSATPLGAWLSGDGPGLLLDAVRQQILADSWRLFLTSSLSWLFSPDRALPVSLEAVLLGSGIGLAAIQVLSRKFVQYEEIIG